MTIEIKIDDLNKEVYKFWENSTDLILDSYSLLSRENKRKQKWSYLKTYERVSSRQSTISEDEVPLTREIKKMVLDEYIKLLSVKTWSEYKTNKYERQN